MALIKIIISASVEVRSTLGAKDEQIKRAGVEASEAAPPDERGLLSSDRGLLRYITGRRIHSANVSAFGMLAFRPFTGRDKSFDAHAFCSR